jgi:hypothetical protein
MRQPLAPISKPLATIYATTEKQIHTPEDPSSTAARLIASRGMLGPGVREPGRECAYLPRMLLGHTADHLGALVAALDADKVVMAPVTLLRPILESAATAFWLMNPAVDDRERLRRWMNLRLASFAEMIRMAGDDGPRHPNAWNIGSRVYWLLQHGKRLGFTVHKQGNRQGLEPIWHLDNPVPGDQRLIKALLEDPIITLDAGPIMHRLTSAVVHARIHGLMLFTVKEQAVLQEDGGWLTPMGIGLDRMAQYSAPVLWGLRACMKRAADFYGWDLTRWDRTTLEAMMAWRPHLSETTPR